MWNDPRTLNACTRAIAAAVVVALVVLLLHHLAARPEFALRSLELRGAPGQVDAAAVRRVVLPELRGNFFTMDLARTRAAFERLPWVRRAQVRRLWPSRLQVQLEEHVALARWGDSGMINTYGELFFATSTATLPVFRGPPGSERSMALRYVELQGALGQVGLATRELHLSARHAWELTLQSGGMLALGRDEWGEPMSRRLDRFLRAYRSTLAGLARRPDYIDLRYANGFALRFGAAATAPIPPAVPTAPNEQKAADE